MKTEGLLRTDYSGSVFAGGVAYQNTPRDLRRGAEEWRACAWSVVRSAREDTDPIYRIMGTRAARYRRALSMALLRRARAAR